MFSVGLELDSPSNDECSDEGDLQQEEASLGKDQFELTALTNRANFHDGHHDQREETVISPLLDYNLNGQLVCTCGLCQCPSSGEPELVVRQGVIFLRITGRQRSAWSDHLVGYAHAAFWFWAMQIRDPQSFLTECVCVL